MHTTHSGTHVPPKRIFIDTLPPTSLVLATLTPPSHTQLHSKLNTCPQLRLLACSNSLTRATHLVMLHRPDVLLIEHNNPHHQHAKALLPLLTCLKKTLPELSVILCTSESSTPPPPLKNLCEGTLVPPYTSEQLALAIELVSCGYTVHMSRNRETTITGQADIQTITAHEREILRLLCLGLGNSDIAQRLFLAESTIKSHTSRLKDKLRAHNRTALALAAMHYGLV